MRNKSKTLGSPRAHLACCVFVCSVWHLKNTAARLMSLIGMLVYGRLEGTQLPTAPQMGAPKMWDENELSIFRFAAAQVHGNV